MTVTFLSLLLKSSFLFSETRNTFRNLRYLITDETSFGSQSSKLKMEHFLQVQEFLLDDRADADGATGCSLELLRDEAAPPPSLSSERFRRAEAAAAAAIAAELKRKRL